MDKTLNGKYLFRVLLVLSIVVLIVWFVHRAQAGKVADAFIEQARNAEKRGELGRAMSLLRHSLAIRPEDTSARAHLALLMEEAAQTRGQLKQAALEMDIVLREDPTRDDVRRQAIKVFMDSRLGEYGEAKKRITEMLTEFPDDGRLYEMRANCFVAGGKFDDAVTDLESAIAKKPESITAYVKLASLYRSQFQNVESADETIDELVRQNSKSAAARTAAAWYWKRSNNLHEFAAAVSMARRCDPEDPEVALAVADLARTDATDPAKPDRNLSDALTLVRAAMNKVSQHLDGQDSHLMRAKRAQLREQLASLYLECIKLEGRLNQTADAKQTAKRGIKKFPRFAALRLELVDICIRNRDWAAANEQLSALANQGYLTPTVYLDQARVLAGQEEWPLAAERLRRALNRTSTAPDDARQLYYLLATCYDHMGEVEQRQEAYVKALPVDRNDSRWLEICLKMAAGFEQMGQRAQARGVYERITTQFPNMLLAAYVRLLVSEAARLPANNQSRWDMVERVLSKAPNTPDWELLRADLAFVQGRSGRADELLARLCETNPQRIEAWASLIQLKLRQKDVAASRRLLEQAKARFGDSADVRMIDARIQLALNPNKAAEYIRASAANLGHFDRPDRHRLLRGLAELAQLTGDAALTDDLWKCLADDSKGNLGLHLIRFDNAVRVNDAVRIEKIRDTIHQLNHRYDNAFNTSVLMVDALYDIWAVRQERGSKDLLDDALKLLVQVDRERPEWGKAALAQGLIHDLKRDSAKAISKYRRAFQLGVRAPDAVRRLVELLNENKQYDDAKKIVGEYLEAGNSLNGLEQVTAEVMDRTGDHSRALELAAKAVPTHATDQKDYTKLLWLSQISEHAGDSKKVVAALQAAIKLDDARSDAWVMLIQHYANRNLLTEARKTLEQAKERINKSDLPLTVAKCYEIIGDSEEAFSRYERLLRENPNDLRVLRSVANFRMRRGEWRDAGELAERILSIPHADPDAEFAYRVLAIALAGDPDYQRSSSVLERLSKFYGHDLAKPLTSADTEEEVRTRALALGLQRDLRRKREAIRLLEELQDSRPLSEENQLLLAQLYIMVGEWNSSRRVLRSLVAAMPDNLIYGYLYAKGLIKQGVLGQAETQVRNIEQRHSDSFRAVELRARLLAASEGKKSAVRFLLGQAGIWEGQVAGIAQLLEQIGAGESAEPLYQKIVSNSTRPEAPLILAAYYGRQDRLDDAMKLCDQVWANPVCRETACGAYVGVLYSVSHAPTAALETAYLRAEKVWQESHGKSIIALNSMAALRNLQGRYDDAISSYKALVAIDAKDAVAQNNLAYLVSAFHGKHDEALSILNRAKESVGPLPALLDTEGQICIAKGDFARAISLLEDVNAMEPSGSHYFHLAEAYAQSGKELEAKAAWNRAIKSDLQQSDLHPLEQDKFKRLQSKIGAATK